jgi:hypothetical protein
LREKEKIRIFAKDSRAEARHESFEESGKKGVKILKTAKLCAKLIIIKFYLANFTTFWTPIEAYSVTSHFFVNWARARAWLGRVIDSRGQKPVLVRTRFFRARLNTITHCYTTCDCFSSPPALSYFKWLFLTKFLNEFREDSRVALDEAPVPCGAAFAHLDRAAALDRPKYVFISCEATSARFEKVLCCACVRLLQVLCAAAVPCLPGRRRAGAAAPVSSSPSLSAAAAAAAAFTQVGLAALSRRAPSADLDLRASGDDVTRTRQTAAKNREGTENGQF